jgi:hypothetical protein
MKTCPFCGAAFVPHTKSPWQLYCNDQCNRDAATVRRGYNTRTALLERRASIGKRRQCLGCDKGFVVRNTPIGVRQKFCSDDCRLRYYSRTRKASARASALKRNYGLTPDDYARLLAAQHGVCAICEEPPKPGTILYVDHSHATGKVRGLLCPACNIAVGFYEARGRKLLNYLRRSNVL